MVDTPQGHVQQVECADKAPRPGAALSYYTVFSLMPLLVMTIAIAGLVFGQGGGAAVNHDTDGEPGGTTKRGGCRPTSMPG